MNNDRPMRTFAGQATARGLAAGPAFLFRGEGTHPVSEYIIAASDVEAELQRLSRARASARRDIECLVQTLRQRAGREDVLIFEGHQMMLEDPVMAAEIEQSVRVDHLNAEAAVHRLADKTRARFGQMNDPYFRERVRDIDDVERRLQRHLGGWSDEFASELKSPCIVVADDLTPSEMMRLPRDFVLGLALAGGSGTSHVALLSRALGIPAVTGLAAITDQVAPGDLVLLDGTSGVLTIRPDAAAQRAFESLLAQQRRLSEATPRTAPVGTLKDGGDVRLCANVHQGVPFETLREQGARGIGLYRSEYLWLDQEREPTEDEQFAAYRAAAEYAAEVGDGASASIRLLDIGGDKIVAGLTVQEANPFLGNRSIRYLLADRAVLRTQLRAILRASAFGPVKLIVPMVACVEELRQTRSLLAEVQNELAAAGVPFDPKLAVGAMIEVPSAAINAEAIAREVDFFSIGTNDLIQYVFAADRGNSAVSYLYQPLNPAILKLMRGVFDAARAHRLPVSVCGESAADPVAGILWVAMGATMLSMSAVCIPVISRVLSRLTRQDLDCYAAVLLNLDCSLTGEEVYRSATHELESRIPDFATLIH